MVSKFEQHTSTRPTGKNSRLNLRQFRRRVIVSMFEEIVKLKSEKSKSKRLIEIFLDKFSKLIGSILVQFSFSFKKIFFGSITIDVILENCFIELLDKNEM